MTTPLRIAFVNDIGQLGGIEAVMLLLIRHLPPARYKPVYFAPESGPMITTMQTAGVEIITVPKLPWWSVSFYWGKRKVLNPLALLYDVLAIIPYIWRLARALRQANIQIVHSAGMVAHVCAGVAARLAGIPHLAHIQDIVSRAWIRVPYVALLDRVTDQFAVISMAVGAAYPPGKTCLVPNAIDLSQWQPADNYIDTMRRQLGLLPQHRVIGMVGRLTPWKGQQVFLQAAQTLAAEDACYRFLLVGDDSVGHVHGYRAELERQANTGELQGRVQFLGRRTDVLDVMSACDVLVHASLKPEPFGLVIIEGMAVGKPVIAAALGGPLDIIEHGVDGLLVPPGDAPILAAAIRSLIDNPDKARNIGERAKQKCLMHYTPTAAAENFGRIYQKLAGQ